MVGYPISLSSCSLSIKMPPHVRERNGDVTRRAGFPLTLIEILAFERQTFAMPRLVFQHLP